MISTRARGVCPSCRSGGHRLDETPCAFGYCTILEEHVAISGFLRKFVFYASSGDTTDRSTWHRDRVEYECPKCGFQWDEAG